MKKKSVCLCLSLLLSALSVCGCRYRGEARAEVESEIAALREENIARAESLEAEASPEEPTAGSSEISAEAEPAKAAPKNDWDGILSSEYQTVGNKYYFRMKFTLTRKRDKGSSRGTACLWYWLDLATGDWDVICPDPLCKHNDPAVCKYLEAGFVSSHTFLDENSFLADCDVNPNKPQLCLFDLKNDTMKPLFPWKQFGGEVLGIEGGTVWLYDMFQTTKNKQTTLTRTLYNVSLADGAVNYERELPANCRPILWHNGLLYCDNVKSIAVVTPETWEETVLLEYAAADAVGQWYLDTNRGEFWFGIVNQDKQTGRIYRYSQADGVCEEVPMPFSEIYYFQLTNTKIYYSPYSPSSLGEGVNNLMDYAAKTVYATDRDSTEGEATVAYEEKNNRILCRLGVFGYLIFGDTLLVDSNQVRTMKYLNENGEYELETYVDMATDVHKIRVDLTTGEEDALTVN